MKRVTFFCGCDITPDVPVRQRMQELIFNFNDWRNKMKDILKVTGESTDPNYVDPTVFLRGEYNAVAMKYNTLCPRPHSFGFISKNPQDFIELATLCNNTSANITDFLKKNSFTESAGDGYLVALMTLAEKSNEWAEKLPGLLEAENAPSNLTLPVHTH